MGKRQVRIPEKEIGSRAAEMHNAELSLIHKNGSVNAGIFIRMEAESIVIKDHHRNVHTIPITALVEIIADKVAAF